MMISGIAEPNSRFFRVPSYLRKGRCNEEVWEFESNPCPGLISHGTQMLHMTFEV